jgi:alpha-amylase
MRRRPEAYHAKLKDAEAAAAAAQTKRGKKGGAVNPHEGLATKEAGLSKLLVYDDHERRSGLVRILDSEGNQVGDFVNGEWHLEYSEQDVVLMSRAGDGLTVTKFFGALGDRLQGNLQAVVEITSDNDFVGTLELEWNINLLGGGANPEAYYGWGDDNEGRHDEPGSVADSTELYFGNRYEGVEISVLVADPQATAEWFPVETVSNSEAGFERVYQGSCLIQRWPLECVANKAYSVATLFSFEQTRDRAAEEVAS